MTANSKHQRDTLKDTSIAYLSISGLLLTLLLAFISPAIQNFHAVKNYLALAEACLIMTAAVSAGVLTGLSLRWRYPPSYVIVAQYVTMMGALLGIGVAIATILGKP